MNYRSHYTYEAPDEYAQEQRRKDKEIVSRRKIHNPESDAMSDDEYDFVNGRFTPDTELGDDELYMEVIRRDIDVESRLIQASQLLSSVEQNHAATIQPSAMDLRIKAHSLVHHDGILVSVLPPKKPKIDINHVPCDIVLVLDSSESMQLPAKIPKWEQNSPAGTRSYKLDRRSGPGELIGKPQSCKPKRVIKTAAKSIVDMLGDNDRIGIVTFSSEVKIKQSLVRATREKKQAIKEEVDKIMANGRTNLFGGIKAGYGLYDEEPEMDRNAVKVIFVLTDGVANEENPSS
ncbi:VWA-domain-containing protein [Pseudovirgaria hyperparasitica]|uniref:VWA-domain-containing protein n=1 Tax=Pseudovirgaria hyperparasitica TaxID=470096 RepID=A0A6A6WHC9_9PEZI|nr:VWA-domain-containing protein [Pseudovirgaria hyperparasitica]KAF2761629.1 VWA-domain-containing protein [Pseudovirgaria hyperparasitica]